MTYESFSATLHHFVKLLFLWEFVASERLLSQSEIASKQIWWPSAWQTLNLCCFRLLLQTSWSLENDTFVFIKTHNSRSLTPNVVSHKGLHGLTHKWLEIYGCIISTLDTAVLVLKHQAISTHSADKLFIILDPFHIKILHLLWGKKWKYD